MSSASQGYLHACQRAELLGQQPPTEEEWAKLEKEREEEEKDNQENAVAQELENSDETIKRAAGGLDELSTILSATQKKINRFKNVCGSLGTLLKARVSSRHGTPEHKSSKNLDNLDNQQDEDEIIENTYVDESSSSTSGINRPSTPSTNKKTDINTKIGSHIDKLDSLINKADNAQYSMQQQNKQMKSFLK